MSAANEFHEALNGDPEPAWTQVWSHIKLGRIFDSTGQHDRAMNEYGQRRRLVITRMVRWTRRTST